jgi:hypothetical protein
MRKRFPAIFFPLFFFLFSCGIEDYLYLNPVDEGSIRLISPNTTATIDLPDFSTIEYYYFTNFSLFYRIYISDVSVAATYPYPTSLLSTINNALASDFSALSYYTSNTTTVVSNLGSQFSTRKYYTLELESADIESVLGSSSLGSQITLDFTPTAGRAPVLGGYTLRRTSGGGNFIPVPSDRRLLNTQELNSSANTAAAINNDVADKSSAAGSRYTYISVYIVTTGRDMNFTPLYSRPTHVGIFSLPNP